MRNSKSRRSTLVIALLGIMASTIYAGEPWIQKPWTKWTEKDIQKILNDSPWTQPIPVKYHPLRNGEQIEVTPPPIFKVGRIPDVNPLESHPVFRPDQVFLARWESAKTIRKALVRKNALALNFRSKQVELEELEQCTKEYLIIIKSSPLNQLPPANENRLRNDSELFLKSSGKRVRSIRVAIRYIPENPDPDSFEFYFTRLDESGEDLIGPTETQINFTAQVGPRVFRARFNPAKMKNQQGPDF